MALLINIEDLLTKRKVESNRIEFKQGWNPVSIYHSICAFANDIDNIGGGYILVGVEEKDGVAQRPVKGIPRESLDHIQREMLQYNQMIEPFYAPRISVEEIDNTSLLVIWVPAGSMRPYSAPADVTAKLKKPVFYIRYGTSSIEAKGEFLDQLRDMANRVPFDERGNDRIQLKDISPLLVNDYLHKINSRLVDVELSANLESVLDQMGLLDGPVEKRLIKNVAAMMFCEDPCKFFPVSRVEIVLFPEGREANPENFIEVPAIIGPVPRMITDTLRYIRTNVIQERIIKQADDERSIKIFNYPYQAIEEAVVNALYHRDYMEREPVEITIEPHRISILSYSGPDRSISMDSIREANMLRSRRYRNRRLGEFLKELDLTEGRATGIPTIQKKLRENGSSKAVIETDEARTYFLIDIPCRKDFVQDKYADIERIVNNMFKICPRYVQDMDLTQIRMLATCLLRCVTPVSAQELLLGIEDISYKQLRRKYLDVLLEMEAINMTMPDKPRSKNQKYEVSDLGKRILMSN
ncbi:MAG: putative DNA binding domain-containing protein [Bacteroidales bacterium]|nr:putative DNA binding domain-containing protein [Bacteroidales bacterium]